MQSRATARCSLLLSDALQQPAARGELACTHPLTRTPRPPSCSRCAGASCARCSAGPRGALHPARTSGDAEGEKREGIRAALDHVNRRLAPVQGSLLNSYPGRSRRPPDLAENPLGAGFGAQRECCATKARETELLPLDRKCGEEAGSGRRSLGYG